MSCVPHRQRQPAVRQTQEPVSRGEHHWHLCGARGVLIARQLAWVLGLGQTPLEQEPTSFPSSFRPWCRTAHLSAQAPMSQLVLVPVSLPAAAAPVPPAMASSGHPRFVWH